MIADGFDSRTLANMDVALDRVCKGRPDGETHELRAAIAASIIRCARSGKTGLGALTEAGERAFARIPVSKLSA